MAAVRGMLSRDELVGLVESGDIETVLVAFSDLYGRLMGKRYDASFFLESVADHGSHACDYLLTVDMEMEPVPGYRFANWERGYGDFALRPDLETLRRATWLDRTAMVLCDVVQERDGSWLREAPRSILRSQIDRLSKAGFTASAGSELEYFLFENGYREAAQKHYADLRPAGWYLEDYHLQQGAREESFNAAARRHLRDSGVPVEGSKGEWGLGQQELNVRYAEVLTMADRHAVYKQCLKELADSLGVSVTFMAKFASDQAGSSCHVHLSLRNESGEAFPGEGALGPVHCSEVFRWFLGGWIAHVPELMVFYAPTINSYKRYQAGSWAPTRLGWSVDNRTAGFRVVGHGDSLRIECRIPGADCNPYLTYAAAIASGLDGIENQIEPPEVFEGNIYEAEALPRVPGSLREANALFAESGFARSVFGDAVVDHYAHFFATEQAAYDQAVTDWERRRYFERI